MKMLYEKFCGLELLDRMYLVAIVLGLISGVVSIAWLLPNELVLVSIVIFSLLGSFGSFRFARRTMSPMWVPITIFLVSAVVIVAMYARIYMQYGLIRGNETFTPDFISAVYFSLVTWTTLGYGDMAPTADARLFAAMQAFVGYVYMGVLVAILAEFLSRKKDGEESGGDA